jgi:erythromycin esterase
MFDEVCGDARVVAVGEPAHWLPECHEYRHELLKQHRFTVFALESGFSEGLAVDAWLHGGPGGLDDVLAGGITYHMGRVPALGAQLAWMKTAGVRFAGLDVPGSNATPQVALAHLREHAPEVVARLSELTGRYAGEHTLLALRGYAALPHTDRDEITALLAALRQRVSDPVAAHEVHLLQALDAGLRGDPAARDRGMADTVQWLLDRGGPGTRIMIAAANVHIQRTPLQTPALQVPVLGSHLAEALGADYVAIAVSGAAGTIAARRADPAAPGGVRVDPVALAPAEPGSVEAAVPAGTLVDLRPARDAAAGPGRPDRMRLMDQFLPTPVADAFDAVMVLPRVSYAAGTA